LPHADSREVRKSEFRREITVNKHAFIATSAAVLLGFAAVLSFGLTSVRDAVAGAQKVESPCDKEGPFAPKVDKDLLRKDLAVEPAEMPRGEKRSLPPSKNRMRNVAFVRMGKDDHFARPATRLPQSAISRGQ